MSHDELENNVHADNAREILKESARPGLSTDRRAVTAQQATALALLAIAAEIRRAGAGGLGAPVPGSETEEPNTCGAPFTDEYGFPDTCKKPKGHDDRHSGQPAGRRRCSARRRIEGIAGYCTLPDGHDSTCEGNPL